MGIVRPQTAIEKDMRPVGADGDTTGFIPIMGPDAKAGVKEAFISTAKKEEKKAGRLGKPFAMQVAIEEFKEYFDNQAKVHMKKYGYVKQNEIKPLNVDWDKYSNLDNFKLVNEDEVPDDNLSNKNPGLNVTSKKTEYRYKGYEKYMYRVMETKEQSIARARKNKEKS